jgi:DNA polymerase-3 subunit chi
MAMTEVLFYHLEKRSLEEVLPELVERALARKWRALIRTESADRAEALDALLWTFSDESFLPHAQAGDGDPLNQPVLITVEPGNQNRADVMFLVGGAVPENLNEDVASLARLVVLFDGRDAAAVSTARTAWTQAKQFGHETTYWKQSPYGKWEKQT